MFKVGEHVCHKFYQKYWLGIVKECDGKGFALIAWENEFGEQWEEAVPASEIE